jgi:hypothetical protein
VLDVNTMGPMRVSEAFVDLVARSKRKLIITLTSGMGSKWRPIFDQDAPEMQRAAGLVNPRVYHSADSNKSEIVIVFDTEDTKKAKEFAASPNLKNAMMKAGVVDTPTIYFLESID